MVERHCKISRNRRIMKGTLFLRPIQFFPPYLLSRCTGVPETWNMVLPSHVLLALNVWSKSISNEGYFTPETKTVFLSYLTSHCSGVTETGHHAFSPHVVLAEQVWSKAVSNEGHFTLEAETVFRPHLACQCSGVTETWNLTLCELVLQLVQVWSKSVINEGHFTLELKTGFLFSPSSIAGWLEHHMWHSLPTIY
jgi:hypothetical protein